MTALIPDLTRVAADFKRSPATNELHRGLSQRVAKALNWTKGPAKIYPVQFDSGTVEISRGLIGPQPAAVFATSISSSQTELLHQAALYAYHASISWGLVATREGATVFNSHWIRQNNWFRLPIIPWTQARQHLRLLRGVTPSGVSTGEIERLAAEVYEPDRFLLPVDDALVERLDYWRSETLRYSKETTEVDENLQALFAQLFILRAVEDRRLAPSLPGLRSVFDANGEVDTQQLAHLLDRAREVIGSDLFEVSALRHIPETVLGGIINDLYIPRNLPYKGARYNFAWMDADVLGLAYEKYLSTILAPTAPPPQLSLFEQPLRGVERISVRKSGGVYYTPNYVVRYLTERCFDHLEDTFGPDYLPRLADFACGSGSFLVAAVDSMIRRLHRRNPKKKWVNDLVSGKHIIGIDVDKRAVTIARLALWLRFAEEPNPLPLPSLETIIVQGDSLDTPVWSTVPDRYDLVLGNPPFMATGRTPDRDNLASRFETAQGRFDYSYLFVELALRHLNPGGILGMVIPNRLFRNRDASAIRNILTAEADILELVDFGANEVFKETSAYVGTMIAQKNSEKTKTRAETLRAINVQNLSSKFLSAALIDAAVSEKETRNQTLVAYRPIHPRGSAPWILVSPSTQRVRSRLEEASQPLGTIAGIYQGIRTGANDIFMVTIESGEPGSLSRVVNGLGDSAVVETTLLYPVIFGSDIRRYDKVSTNRYLIYPYRNATVIPERELKSKYPRTFKYLQGYRDILVGRTSIHDSGLRWYELVRKRDQAWLESPKLLIRDLATETSFAMDERGSTFLVGGTAVVPSDPDLLLALLAYLNSRLMNEYLGQITPLFRKGFQKFEPQHLEGLPILSEIISKGKLADRLAGQAARALEAKEIGAEGELRAAEESIERLIEKELGIGKEGLL